MYANEKRQLERNVLDTFNKIPFATVPESWFYSKEYAEFVDAWKELVEFYRFDDTPIDLGVSVVKLYIQFTSFLGGLIEPKPVYIERLEYILQEITYWMDELIKEAERNLYLSEEQD